MAKLKAGPLESLDGIPEPYHELYEKTDEGFVLSGIDDTDFKSRIKEFRENNINLNEQLKTATKDLERYKDIDPEQYKKLLEIKQRIESDEEARMIAEGKLEEVLERRTEALRADLGTRAEKAEERAQKFEEDARRYRQQVNEFRIGQAFQTSLEKSKHQIQKGAHKDVMNRIHAIFRMDDKDTIRAYEPDGKTPKYGKDGKEMTFDEAIEDLVQEAPFLFVGSRGGGAEGGNYSRSDQEMLNETDPLAFGRNAEKIAKTKIRP